MPHHQATPADPASPVRQAGLAGRAGPEAQPFARHILSTGQDVSGLSPSGAGAKRLGACPALGRPKPGGAPRGQERQRLGGYFTQVLSWMMGSSTASTMSITMPPIATMSKGSRMVAM